MARKKSVKKGSKNNHSKNETIAKLKAKLDAIDNEIKHDVTPAIVASFGFIIALVWRDAIRSILDEVLLSLGLMNKAYIYDIISAVIVTIVVIIIMVSVSKYGRSKKKERIQKAVRETVNEIKNKK